MSIKHFNYGSYDINNNCNDDILNDINNDEIDIKPEHLNEYDNHEKRKIEQKYHKYERYGMDKLYVSLATGILLIGIFLSRIVNHPSIIIISAIAIIIVYVFTVILLKYKKQKCIDKLGYVPKPQINKIYQLFNKMKGD